MKLLLVFGAIVALAAATCVNNCSPPNGNCVDNVCVCEDNFGGLDCSIPDRELYRNIPVNDHVELREWKYYHVEMTDSKFKEFAVEVNQTSSGDCDTYVRFGDYPNKQQWDQRDLSTNPDTHIVVPAQVGTYYIGVYGFLTTSYTIEALFEKNCDSECSHHGTCHISDGTYTCICDHGYVGADCSIQAPVMQNQTNYEGQIDQGVWTYYTIMNDMNTVEIFLDQSGPVEEDCDMYVKFGNAPTLDDFDYRDTSTLSSHDLKITDALSGNYTYGIYGYRGCTYSTSALTYMECPNKCSGSDHGTCSSSGDRCSCKSNFAGDACEEMVNALTIDKTQNGYVDVNYWNYYFFSVSTQSDAYVNVYYHDSSAEDCDLYVLRDDKPTTTNFDYRDFSFQNNKTIYIENPDPSVSYQVGVYGYKPCTYTLKFGLTETCPDCGDHGKCESGHCICDEGWGGDTCADRFGNLESGEQVDGVVNTFVWRYFTFEAAADYDVTILMKELNSTGYVWLYESREYFPDAVEYENADTETNSQIHDITFTPEVAGTVYVGVGTSPLAVSGQNLGFSLEVYQASFGGKRSVLKVNEVKK